MNLREYLRNEWSEYIRPVIIKNKCDWCNSENELHLHHIDRFHNLLVETLEELKLQELDTDCYDDMELKQISNFMLAKQLKSQYKTLCKKCHMIFHSKEKFKDEYKRHYYNPNGGYINININLFKEYDLDESKCFKFLRLVCNMNYDNFISNGTRKIRISKNIIERNLVEIAELLNISTKETKKNVDYFLEKKLLCITEDGSILINKDIASKGFNNYSEKIKIFIENYKNIYEQITEIRKHKTVGKIIKSALCDLDNVDISYVYDPTNVSKNKKYLKEINGLCKFEKNKVIINPLLMYKKELDFSYKDEILKYESI